MIEIKKLNEKKSLTVVAEVEHGTPLADIKAKAASFGPGWYCYTVGNFNGNTVNLGNL